MPDRTPSSLDQLAGIEQDAAKLRATRHAFLPESELFAHLTEVAERLDTLATLREVLTEWRAFLVESRARVVELVSYTDDQRAAIGYTLDTITAAWDKEIAALLTPDSPRQAGEE